MAKSRTTICNECFEEIKQTDAYKVSRYMHKGSPEMGEYYTYYCKECTDLTETFKQIITEPKATKKKKA